MPDAPLSQGRPEDRTMSHMMLSDVEWINLNVLAIIRAGLQHDRASTCCKFALNAEQADYLTGLSLE